MGSRKVGKGKVGRGRAGRKYLFVKSFIKEDKNTINKKCSVECLFDNNFTSDKSVLQVASNTV